MKQWEIVRVMNKKRVKRKTNKKGRVQRINRKKYLIMSLVFFYRDLFCLKYTPVITI